MDGDNIYKSLARKGIIVMGNEANGISKELENCHLSPTCHRVWDLFKKPSLNVATATAIVLSEFKRGVS
jgi:TrmH family RNA methyltransferase